MFYNNSEFNQVIDINNEISINNNEIVEMYDILQTSAWIIENQFQKVGLQFPDELLPLAANILKLLEEKTNYKCVILGDTSFGSCCVDIVAGQHYNVDAIVHYGRACLTNSLELPVRYVFGIESVQSKTSLIQGIKEAIAPQQKLCIVYDFQFYADVLSIYEELSHSYSVIFSWPCLPDNKSNINMENPIKKCGRYFDVSTEAEINSAVLIYIGLGGLALENILLSFGLCRDWYSCNPLDSKIQNENTRLNFLIKRRRFLIEKCKDAQRVGILVGSLSVKNYLSCIDHLRSSIKYAGKCSYTFAVGKLNIAKLANFPEIDVFVIVACPENVIVPSREYYKPIVTPFEMELACNPDISWTTEPYETDFNAILDGGAWHLPASERKSRDSFTAGDVSLITGTVRCAPSNNLNDESQIMEGALVSRHDLQVAQIQKHEKSWHGLDPKLGETPVTGIVKGRKGIAIRYEDE